MEDEGDEDWTNNNEKSGESDDEDALKSVEDLKKSVDDLKKLVPCTIEEFAKVIYSISLFNRTKMTSHFSPHTKIYFSRMFPRISCKVKLIVCCS
jgi:hypothetical protein